VDNCAVRVTLIRVSAEKERDDLEQQLALARRVVDAVPGMLAYWDSNQRCCFANAAYERWFGCKPEALIGKTLQELLGPIYPRNLPYITGALQGREQLFEREIPDPAGGLPRHSQAHYMPDVADGMVRGFAVQVSDVTELKRTQAELIAAQRWAAVGTLAAGVAHEINTPLQFVGDNLNFLRNATRQLMAQLEPLRRLRERVLEGAPLAELADAASHANQAERASRWSFLEKELPNALDACVDGLERVATIVDSLKEFAHSSPEMKEPADLNRAIEGTLALAVNEYKHVAELKTELGELPPIVCHIGDLRQVVLNLVVNAAHAIADVVRGTEQKGELGVRTWRDGDEVLIAVTDTGAGIPERIRHRIFEPFFTTKGVGKGTGQGLAIAWSLVTQRHHGALSFETVPGRGTTFHVRLPLSGEPPRAGAK
jgi:two-component system, NtrC family, sensor kinase